MTTSFLWGFLAVFLKFSLSFSDVITTVFVRFSLAFIILFIIFAIKKREDILVFIKPPPLALLASGCLAANYWAYFKGLEYTTPGNAQIMIQFAPLLFALSGFLIFKESIVRIQKIGLVTTLVGMSFFYQNQLQNLLTSSEQYHKGNLFMLIAVLSWTVWAILQKILVKNHSPQKLNLLTYGLSTVFFAFSTEWGTFTRLSPLELGVFIFLGFNTVVAYGALSESMKYIPANQASFIIILNPLITLIVVHILHGQGYAWVGHPSISTTGYLGVFFILTGVTLVVTKGKFFTRNQSLPAKN
jgi:drug/metabolite transporter (DMT)-like permease